MTATDNAVSAIQKLQSDLANLTSLLQAQQAGNNNGIPVDTNALEALITTQKTTVSNDWTALNTALASV